MTTRDTSKDRYLELRHLTEQPVDRTGGPISEVEALCGDTVPNYLCISLEDYLRGRIISDDVCTQCREHPSARQKPPSE